VGGWFGWLVIVVGGFSISCSRASIEVVWWWWCWGGGLVGEGGVLYVLFEGLCIGAVGVRGGLIWAYVCGVGRWWGRVVSVFLL